MDSALSTRPNEYPTVSHLYTPRLKVAMGDTTIDSSRDENFTATKGKMKVQQRMIDLTARELQSTRLSSRTIAATDASSSPSCALKENIVLLEVHI